MTALKSFAVLFLVVTSTPAIATTTFSLFSNGHWEVFYQIDSYGVSTCVAEISSDQVDFSIDVGEGFINAWYITDHNDFGPGRVRESVRMQIDDNPAWVTPATGIRTTVQIRGLHSEFLRQIYYGERLEIHQEDENRYDASFSLDGSAAALTVLSDCFKKLGWPS
jgi:hypothetical protein